MLQDIDSDDEDLLFGRTLKVQKELQDKLTKMENKKMSSRFAELGNHYIKRGMSINFHTGFRDLNPTYH